MTTTNPLSQIMRQLFDMKVNATTTNCTTNYRTTTRRYHSPAKEFRNCLFTLNQKTANSSCKLCTKLYTWWNSSLRQTRDKVITKLEIEDTWDKNFKKKSRDLRDIQIVRQNKMDQKHHQDQHNRDNWLTSQDNTQPTVNRISLPLRDSSRHTCNNTPTLHHLRRSFLVYDEARRLTCISKTSNNETQFREKCPTE